MRRRLRAHQTDAGARHTRRDKLLYLMAEGRSGLFKRLQRACDAVIEHETPATRPLGDM